ncbi:hypothetical protein [Streptomyces sp. NPDC002676]
MAAPHELVEAYCAATGIPFLPETLSWQPGARKEWAPSERWHADAGASSGFQRKTNEYRLDVDQHPVLSGYLAHHLPFYERLREHRLQP